MGYKRGRFEYEIFFRWFTGRNQYRPTTSHKLHKLEVHLGICSLQKETNDLMPWILLICWECSCFMPVLLYSPGFDVYLTMRCKQSFFPGIHKRYICNSYISLQPLIKQPTKQTFWIMFPQAKHYFLPDISTQPRRLIPSLQVHPIECFILRKISRSSNIIVGCIEHCRHPRHSIGSLFRTMANLRGKKRYEDIYPKKGSEIEVRKKSPTGCSMSLSFIVQHTDVKGLLAA